MDNENGGDSEGELAVLGLVTEEVHTQEGTDAAAGNGQPNEGVFRDAPLPSPGLPFVDAVEQEGQDVDADKVDDEVAHGADSMNLFYSPQNRVSHKAHKQGGQDVPPVEGNRENSLIQAPGQEVHGKDGKFGLPDGFLHGIEEKSSSRDSNNITNGIGQVPVIDMICIDVGPISEIEKPPDPGTQHAKEEANQPFPIALLHGRSQHKQCFSVNHIKKHFSTSGG